MAKEDQTGLSDKRGYFGGIVQSAKSIMEGMSITLAELTRANQNHTTVQYPDRTAIPVVDSLPERYRGFLEVDMDICTACKACERDCPINVIAIDLEKVEGGTRAMTRFDIDMGKCMYCGLCVEACVVESTGALRHTREFEAAGPTLDSLVFRFVPDRPLPLYKAPKDVSQVPVGEYGPHAREARERAMRDNPALLDELREAYFAERRARPAPAL